MLRTYNELITFETFLERFNYLKLIGNVGSTTFGFDRYLNQALYHSNEWRQARAEVIHRDRGLDLAMPGYEIHDRVIVHHMNPITVDQIENDRFFMFDINQLVSTTQRTHNAIHFGNSDLLHTPLVSRKPGDTKLW